MKKNYMAPQCEQVVLNVSEEILDGHLVTKVVCQQSLQQVVLVLKVTRGSGVDGFEAKESEWGRSLLFTVGRLV